MYSLGKTGVAPHISNACTCYEIEFNNNNNNKNIWIRRTPVIANKYHRSLDVRPKEV